MMCPMGGHFLLKIDLRLKKPTTYTEQLARLRVHGVDIEDEGNALEFLQNVSYYRLSGYFLVFQDKNKKADKISFDRIVSIYRFDSMMRFWFLAVIEEIEQYLKTQISYYVAHKYGAESYLDESMFSRKHNHQVFREKLDTYKRENRNNPVFIHHETHYAGHMPIWAIVDVFTLGTLSIFYADMKTEDKKSIARSSFSTGTKQLESWLRSLTELRNRCAHFARLYFWHFISTPRRAKNHGHNIDNTLFSQIYMLKLLHPNQLRWNQHIQRLICIHDEFIEQIELQHIGFPEAWKCIISYA